MGFLDNDLLLRCFLFHSISNRLMSGLSQLLFDYCLLVLQKTTDSAELQNALINGVVQLTDNKATQLDHQNN